MPPLRVVQIVTDSRENFRDYGRPDPYFAPPVEALLQGFSELPGLEVHIVSCLQQPTAPRTRWSDNVWCHSLHVPKLGWLRTGYQGCIRAVRRRLRELQPDLVHGQGTERECALSAAFSGFPNLVTIHGNMAELARLFQPRPGTFHWWTARLESFTLRRTGGVFCNSGYTERLVRPRARRTWRVPNAVRPAFFAPSKRIPVPGRCVLVNVGVIGPRKRQLELLDLARQLHQEGAGAEFQFVGTSDQSDYSRRFLDRVREAEHQGYARYLGTKSTAELIDWFDQAAGMVHFPREESFGLVVAEALARGLKLFGTRTGGIVEIAAAVPGAELFEVEDWDGLRQAIARWIAAGFSAPGQGVEPMRACYHPEVVARRHVEIYREFLSASS